MEAMPDVWGLPASLQSSSVFHQYTFPLVGMTAATTAHTSPHSCTFCRRPLALHALPLWTCCLGHRDVHFRECNECGNVLLHSRMEEPAQSSRSVANIPPGRSRASTHKYTNEKAGIEVVSDQAASLCQSESHHVQKIPREA